MYANGGLHHVAAKPAYFQRNQIIQSPLSILPQRSTHYLLNPGHHKHLLCTTHPLTFPPTSHLSAMANACNDVPPPRPHITHVIFDMDGLLLDTEDFYSQVQDVILERFGKTFDWSLKAKMMGTKAMESAEIFVQGTGIGEFMTPEEFLVEREDMLQELFPTCQLMPGVRRLVTHLHTKGIPMAVATGSDKDHFEIKTQKHGDFFSMMHHIVMGDDPEVKNGKPSPDIFLAAARRFEGGPVNPFEILVFEDSPGGVSGAKNAGMSAVMVPDPRLDSSYHLEADLVLSSISDFKPQDWGLPPYEDSTNLN